MIFARFAEKKNTEGQFTCGKVYLATEAYHYLATSIGQLDVVDDVGKHVKIDPKAEDFVFSEVVYGVWIGPPLKNIEIGKVFVIDDVDNENSLPQSHLHNQIATPFLSTPFLLITLISPKRIPVNSNLISLLISML